MLRLVLLVSCALSGSLAVNIQEIRARLIEDQDNTVKEQCFSDLGMTAEEIAEEIKTAKEDSSSEKLACVVKCIQEKLGCIGEDKMLVIENLEKLPVWAHIPEDRKPKLLECLGAVGAIETCMDVDKEKSCLQNALA